MSMGPWRVYLRYDEDKKSHYISFDRDEEKSLRRKDLKSLNEYGEKEALIKKWHGKGRNNSDIVYEVVDETDAKFREKWVKFKKDRIVGWQKGGKFLTKEMMELLGADGKVSLDKLSNREKDAYYELIARKVMRGGA